MSGLELKGDAGEAATKIIVQVARDPAALSRQGALFFKFRKTPLPAQAVSLDGNRQAHDHGNTAAVKRPRLPKKRRNFEFKRRRFGAPDIVVIGGQDFESIGTGPKIDVARDSIRSLFMPLSIEPNKAVAEKGAFGGDEGIGSVFELHHAATASSDR